MAEKVPRPPTRALHPRNVQQTLTLYFGFLILGMTMTVCGPALPELEVLVSRPTSEISWMFSGRAAGLLLGSLICGALDGRVGPWIQLGLSQLGLAAMMAAIPNCRSLPAIIAASVVSGFCAGFMASGCTMTVLKIWSTRNGPWMQGLHCLFGVGAIICPFIVSPFLSIKNEQDTPDLLPPSTNHSTSLLNSTLTTMSSYVTDGLPAGSYVTDGLQYNANTTAAGASDEIAGSKLIFGFLIFTALSAISGIAFLIVACTDYKKEWLSVRDKDDVEGPDKKSETCVCGSLRTLLLVLVFFLYFSYFIAETNTASYLTTFILRHAGKGKTLALRMISGYWMTFTCGRALGALAISKIHPRYLLGADIICVLIFISPLMFHVASVTWVLWVCVLGVGFSLSTVYSTGITWLEGHIDISGSLGAMFAVSGAVGEMVGSPLTGVLFGVIGGASYAYVMFGTSCVMLTFYVLMMLTSTRLPKPVATAPCDIAEKTSFI